MSKHMNSNNWLKELEAQQLPSLPTPRESEKRRRSYELVEFTDCCNVTVNVETSGVDGGDGSKHVIELEFSGANCDILVTNYKGERFEFGEPTKLRFEIRGDAEARNIIRIGQMLAQFFVNHGFHQS